MPSLILGGLLIGAFVGALFAHQGIMLGAAFGLALGLLASRFQEREAALERRLRGLENELRELVAGKIAPRDDVVAARAPAPAPLPLPEPEPEPSPLPPPVRLAEIPSTEASEPPPELPPSWWSRLMAGNPLAKVGVVLLFFGVASALRLAAEYGLMPIGLRLALAAAAGLGLVVFGMVQAGRGERRTFGLAIQGGGFALMYLVAYFMLQRYAMIGPVFAFAIFAALGVACVGLAARQDGPALAVLGLSGAFIAPLLAGGRADTPLGLFSYFALLNLFILWVDWFRAWRVLNIAGFVFTLVIGMAWGIDAYRPDHYLVTQLFLAAFLIVYSAMPVLTALLRAPGAEAWREGILLFGTPLAGAVLQAALLEGERYGLAWSALVASLYYFGLWALLRRSAREGHELIERANLGLAIAFLTLAVPLAFEAQVTSAFWAAEGAAVLWFGVRSGRLLAQGCGLAMQVAAGGALFWGWNELNHRLPVANDVVLGGALIAAAGVASARLLRSLDDEGRYPPVVPFIWAMLWWLGIGLEEIEHFAPAAMQAAYALLFVTATVLILEALAVAWRWPQVRRAAVLLPLALWAAVTLTWTRSGHPLAGLTGLAFALAGAVHLWLLARHERDADDSLTALALPRHLAGWWLLLLALPAELVWQAGQLAPGNDLWPAVIWLLTLAAAITAARQGALRGLWPFAAPRGGYDGIGLLPPLAGLVLWLAGANLTLSGGGSGLPWLPLLNVLDLALLAGLAALWPLTKTVQGRAAGFVYLVAALGFLTVSAEAARLAHHFGGVAWASGPMFASRLFQSLLTLLWTVLAIGVMIHAARHAQRTPWFAGFGLLAVVGTKLLLVDAAGRGTLMWTGTLLGVAVLVLAASYFAPLPPKPEKSALAGRRAGADG